MRSTVTLRTEAGRIPFLTVPSYLAIDTTFRYNYDHTNTILVPLPQSE